MTFDSTGLLIFLLAIVPGFIAQQSRHSVSPRSLPQKTVLEETGEYVVNSVFVHLLLIATFTALLRKWKPSILATADLAVQQRKLFDWAWDQRRVMFVYFLMSLGVGFALGILRGVLALNQPIRKWLLRFSWCRSALTKAGILSFLQEEPVWWGVLRQNHKDEVTFIRAKMKAGGDFYAGELRSYGILGDSDREKDFSLIHVYHGASSNVAFRQLDADGILLNFADVEVFEIMKRFVPRHTSERKLENDPGNVIRTTVKKS
jgi:hypothetical protein